MSKLVYLPIYIAPDSSYPNFKLTQGSFSGNVLVMTAAEIKSGNKNEIATRINSALINGGSLEVSPNNQTGFDLQFLQKEWNKFHPGVYILELELSPDQLREKQEEVKFYDAKSVETRTVSKGVIASKLGEGSNIIKPAQIISLKERVQLSETSEGYLPAKIPLTTDCSDRYALTLFQSAPHRGEPVTTTNTSGII